MFTLTGVFAHFRRAKRPDPDPTQTDAAHQDFDAWQRYWDALQRGIDELVAQLPEDPGQRA